MDVIDFVEKDVKKNFKRPKAFPILLGAGIFLIPIALGLVLRDDENGVFEPRILIPNLLSAVLLFLITFWSYKKNFGRSFYVGLIVLVLGIFLATERIFFPVGERTVYDSSSAFWRENARCFTKGGFTTVVSSIWLCLFAYFSAALPSRRWRLFLSLVSGVSGTIMLGFHCDSSSIGHVLIAHIGQGIFFGTLFFIAQEIRFSRKLTQEFPALAKKLNHFRKIG